MKQELRRRTFFKCVVCGKITTGRIGREGRLFGDGSHRFPRRHKVDGVDCIGNIEEAEWVDILVPIKKKK